MSAVSTERATDDAQPNTTQPHIGQTTVAEIEGDIREFVRKDAASLRRIPEVGSEAFVNNLNSIVQRVAGSSLAEIDSVISELVRLRELLHHEGQRVQREVMAYAQMS